MEKDKLYIDRFLFPVTALGPGKRIALWVAGCGRHCPGCANPELWERRESQCLSVESSARLLEKLIREKKPDGITITGGEPFDQAPALCALLDRLCPEEADVLIYSGYRLAELRADTEKAELLKRATVVVDGEYIEALNTADIVMRGSANQNINYLREEYRSIYEPYLLKGRQIQNFVYDYRTLSVGIHLPDSGKAGGMNDE